MAFDVEGYRKAAKDAGFSDEEIQKDIDEETQGIAAKGADAKMENVKVGKDFMGIPEWLQPAAALTAAGLLGAGATGVGLKLKDRMTAPQQPTGPRVEPTFGIPDIGGNPPPPPPPPPPGGSTQNKFTPPQGDVIDVASRPVGEPRVQIGGPKALPAPEVAAPTPAAPAPTAPVAPPATVEPVAVAPKPIDPLVQARIDALAADQRRKDEAHAAEQRRKDEAHANRLSKDAKHAEASTQKKQGEIKSNIPAKDQAILADNAEAKARAEIVASGQPKPKTASPIGGTATSIEGAATPPAGTPPVKPVTPSVPAPELETKLGAPTATTGSGMPAYKGEGGDKAKMRKEFSTIKDVPSGYVFVPNGQNMDIVRNAVGQEQYTKNLKESGGYPVSTDKAYQQSREINKLVGRPPRAEAIEKGLSLGETTKGITKAVAGSKAVRVAGVTGALVLASDLASAAEQGVSAAKQGDTQMARGYVTDILGALTGPLGMIASQTFGTSPEDLKILRAAEQSRKVGGGRGIAPPSEYLR
jgi:hypothetical protein